VTSLPLSGPTAPSALDADGIELASVARRWLEARSPVAVARAALEAEAESLPPFWDELTDLGWVGLAVPTSAGGQGATTAELCTVVEEWGRAVAPGPFPGTAAVATLVGRHAPDLVRPLLAGAAAAVVPPDDGPVEGGGCADWFLVRDDVDRWALVPRDALQVQPLRSADGTRRLARVTLPSGGVGPSAGEVAVTDDEVAHLTALLRAAEAVGVASWCVHTAAAYAADRVQFGRPIGQFQAVKHRCADALCRLEEARAACWDAAGLDHDDPQSPLAVAVAAALGPEGAFACAKDAIQVLGGIGYTWEHDAHLYLRRATALHHLNGGSARWRDEVVARVEAGQRRTLELDLPPEAEAVRDEVRAAVAGFTEVDRSTWNLKLADEGWMVPHWPRPWGRDAGPLEQLVIDQEFRAARIRRPHLQVAGWVLPTLIAHGSAAQQERFVAPSLRHEVTWCQLFSEPGAGSDLASLTTRAERVDGGWAITGQKVWTTMAKEADWGICLARTDPDAPKHDGITCFLVDMSSAGIDVRPLQELTGFAMFNEVFLDGVFVPDDAVVGAVHDGWRCARTTLENERVSMASGSSFGPGVEAVLDLARRPGDTIDDPVVRQRVGELLVTAQALAVMGLRTTVRALGASTGNPSVPGPEASVRKLLGVEHEQRVQEVGMSLLGPWAVVDEDDGARWFGGFLGNRALSIAGGTSEIQRNVIGERLLGLPRDS
jgi:alkylation response protein AidB-like acyl-CoA dehydrogenase